MSKATKNLIRLVEKSASEQNSCDQAQQMIQEGADITAPTSKGPMVDAVIAQEKLLRQTMNGQWKAYNCSRLISVFKKTASTQLSGQIFSGSGGNLQDMRLLVSLGASCYQSDSYGPLGLLGAVLNQDKVPIQLYVVKFILESDEYAKNALTSINDQGKTCLSLAKSNSKCPKDVIDYIQQQFDERVNQILTSQPQIDPNQVIQWIRAGANIEATDKNGNTILSNATNANNLELVRALVSVGSNPTHKNNAGLTPLQIADKAVPKNHQLIAFLKEQSVNVALKTLIETKKSKLTTEEVQRLLETGANINAPMTDGDSPLHLLIRSQGTVDMVKVFVNDFGADLSVTNNKGYRPLETCILIDKPPCSYLQALLTLPKMTNDKFRNSKSNKTLLQFAVEQNRPDAAKLIQDELNLRLWNCTVRINTHEDNNKTVMDAFYELITCGAQINHLHTDKEYDKWTVLHLAARTSTVRVLQYMIVQLQADYTLQNGDGDYPISIAAQYGHQSLVEYLKSLPKSNLNVRNKTMQTPLHLAAKNYHLLVVQYLVQWGADDQIQNASKKTPLDIARENVPKSKDEEINNKKIIQFLTQLVCPPMDNIRGASSARKKPTDDLDTCDLPAPVTINTINISVINDEAALGPTKENFFSTTPNDRLLDAAKNGSLASADSAIAKGADVRYRRRNRNALERAQTTHNEYNMKLRSTTLSQQEIQQYRAIVVGCEQIVQLIQRIASTKMIEAIQKSDAGLAVSYHQAGAPITTDLLYIACNASDNVEIVDYLVNQNAEIYRAIINNTSPKSAYRIAKEKNFNKLAAYLKYHLSFECTKAIKGNNLQLAKSLVSSGASVDLYNSNNLDEAIKHSNVELVELLCVNGAKMPSDWLSAKTITTDSAMFQHLKSEIRMVINRHLIERRLRFAAANGDLKEVIQCLRLGVDINSVNCHGSTALLCAIQHGNYFSIVHLLVSRNASILHSNKNVSMSLIDLANEQKYKEIAAYLLKELNTQFLSAILSNNRQSAEKFAQLNVDFNYRDEQQRTPLHYAVQYHGSDLVSWLCDRGSVPTICDMNGDFPIMQAVEKGDYNSVKLFVTKYSATKKQTNKDGLTALQLAQKLGFHRIVQFIETGKDVPESETDRETKAKKPTHDEATLIQAVQMGRMKIIEEFIADECYDSRDEKIKLCEKLIKEAKKVGQMEFLHILKQHHQALIRELESREPGRSNITLSERHQQILLGVLRSLNNLIANSSVILNPADPNTYTQFFVGLREDSAKRSQELQQVKTEQDVTKLIEKDQNETEKKLESIQAKLQEDEDSRDATQARILDAEKQLREQKNLSAIRHKEFLDQKKRDQQQLATYECAIFLFQRQQEAILNRRKAIEFFKCNMNLFIFYRVVEHRLEALFQSSLAAQGGYVKIESTTKFGKSGTAASLIPTKMPIINLAPTIVKTVLSPVFSKIDQKQLKEAWYNISTMGNLGELGRIATETAGLITLYYNEQIQSIDASQILTGSNIFNHHVHWLKQIYDVRPESSEDLAVILVAEYVTAWIIDGLKLGSNIIPTEPIPQQLWLHVAKKDPTDLGNDKKTTDILGLSSGQQKITVKNMSDKKTVTKVQIRYLIGCVSVITHNNSIYQYQVPPNPVDAELLNLENFGYVYAAPFSSDDKAITSILNGRKLQFAKQDKDGKILTRFKDIMEHVQAFVDVRDQSPSKSSITRETAHQVAEVLREEKIFPDSQAIKEQLELAEENIELTVQVLREELQEKTSYYQVSIDAAHEQLKQESEANRQAMQKDNEMRYEQALKKLTQHTDEAAKRSQILMEQFMRDIQQQFQEEMKKIFTIVETAKEHCFKAMTEAQAANETSRQAVKTSTEAMNSVEKLSQWADQRHKEFQVSMKNSEERINQATLAQQQSYQQSISNIHEDAKQKIDRLQDKVKESAQDAKESKSTTKAVHEMMKTQQETHNAEMKKMSSEVREMRQQTEKAVTEAREAQRKATRAAETTASTAEQMEKLARRFNGS